MDVGSSKTEQSYPGIMVICPRCGTSSATAEAACSQCGHIMNESERLAVGRACLRQAYQLLASSAGGGARLMASQERSPVLDQGSAADEVVRMYLTAVDELLKAGTVYLQNRWYRKLAEMEYPQRANRSPEALLIGGYGNDSQDGEPYATCRYLYLIPDVTFKAVDDYYRTKGLVFCETAKGIKARLRESGLLLPSANRPYDYMLASDLPKTLRILRLGA